MVGGYDFARSQFNRATQAYRQPGSAFKPLVYAAALDNGYTPSSVVMDAPIEIQSGNEVWRPENYGGKFYGPATLRTGIEKSRNVMTVRLAQDMGMPLIREYAKRFGVYDDLAPYLPMALGAGETTVLRMAAARDEVRLVEPLTSRIELRERARVARQVVGRVLNPAQLELLQDAVAEQRRPARRIERGEFVERDWAARQRFLADREALGIGPVERLHRQ